MKPVQDAIALMWWWALILAALVAYLIMAQPLWQILAAFGIGIWLILPFIAIAMEG